MSEIQIKVIASHDKDKCSIQAEGEIVRIITDGDRAKFCITDRDLKNCVESYHGKNPDDAYVKSPTPWNDLYKTYGWDQVQIRFRPTSAKVLETTSRSVALIKKAITNNSDVTANVSPYLKPTVNDEVETIWNTSEMFEVSQPIDISVEILGSDVASSTSMSFSDVWGQSGSQNISITIDTGRPVSATLGPGESCMAYLNATHRTMRCRVEYEVCLTGQVAVNYSQPYKDHHFWGFDIVEVMQSGCKQVVYTATEDITVGYYGDGNVVLENWDERLQTGTSDLRLV